jgi:hypothetical protein
MTNLTRSTDFVFVGEEIFYISTFERGWRGDGKILPAALGKGPHIHR